MQRHFTSQRQSDVFTKWLRALRDRRARVIVIDRVARLARFGVGDTKRIGARVEELRIPFGPGYRIYFTVVSDEVVFLLVGGDKGSQTRDIVLAQRLAADAHDIANDPI